MSASTAIPVGPKADTVYLHFGFRTENNFYCLFTSDETWQGLRGRYGILSYRIKNVYRFPSLENLPETKWLTKAFQPSLVAQVTPSMQRIGEPKEWTRFIGSGSVATEAFQWYDYYIGSFRELREMQRGRQLPQIAGQASSAASSITGPPFNAPTAPRAMLQAMEPGNKSSGPLPPGSRAGARQPFLAKNRPQSEARGRLTPYKSSGPSSGNVTRDQSAASQARLARSNTQSPDLLEELAKALRSTSKPSTRASSPMTRAATPRRQSNSQSPDVLAGLLKALNEPPTASASTAQPPSMGGRAPPVLRQVSPASRSSGSSGTSSAASSRKSSPGPSLNRRPLSKRTSSEILAELQKKPEKGISMPGRRG